ncbi:MAG: RHS repeat protein [Deltaproteobacteria bacterium]|nr:RHS repeat protein [Deltaproteobacteria bacterium]
MFSTIRLASLLALALSTISYAFVVNRLNGGASIIYVDFNTPGSALPLELTRTYNSITAIDEKTSWLGVFGWGWTAPFETTLTTTPERIVLLRDGATGNTIVFKPQGEDSKGREAFFEAVKKAFYEKKLGRTIKAEELRTLQLPQTLLSRMKSDPIYRKELATQYDIKLPIPQGELLISTEYGYQTIEFKNNQWIRSQDGKTQVFDGQGRLVRQQDRNGAFYEFRYSPTQKLQLTEMVTGDRSNGFKFTFRQERIVEVSDSHGKHAKYTYDSSGNLIQSVDSNGITYLYKYENKKFPHLITRIEYPNESPGTEKIFREISYDNQGLVTAHRDKDGSFTQYIYGRSAHDPENNFFTKTIRQLGKIKTELYEDFFLKAKPDGSKYLYKQETRQNGSSITTVFTACCGKPSQITKNGEVTQFKYYEDGMLKEKVSPREVIRLEYDARWKKANKIYQNGATYQYDYDARGNLVKASNSKAEKVSLKYDTMGRVLAMVNQTGREISFRYDGSLGRPVVISEKGVGTIKLEYDGSGRITKTQTIVEKKRGRKPSELASQETVKRIMSGFEQLMDLIRPAGVPLTAG